MESLTRAELDLLHDLIVDRWDGERHYPDNYTEEEIEASSTLGGKVLSEAKRRKAY